VRQYASGDTVVLTLIRGGKALDVSASLATSPNA
jgi:S1-C subfamily serine protease